MMSVALRSSKAAQSSYGSTTCVLARPCLSAFSFEASLPASVRGPVQSCALRRLASIWAADDMRMSSIRADWRMGVEGSGQRGLGSDWKEGEYIFGVDVIDKLADRTPMWLKEHCQVQGTKLRELSGEPA